MAVGGVLPKEFCLETALERMHVFTVVSHVPPRREEAERESSAVSSPVAEAMACTVCQETLVAPRCELTKSSLVAFCPVWLTSPSRVLGCGHTFCEDCIARWFRDKSTCPTCRAPSAPDAVASGGAPCVQLEALVRLLGGTRRGDAWTNGKE